MLLKHNEIKLVQQRRDDDCVIACLAMVTGLSYEQILVDFELRDLHLPFREDAILPALVRYNIFPSLVVAIGGLSHIPTSTVSYVSGPSLNVLGGMHAFIITCDEAGAFKIFDPSFRKVNKKVVFETAYCLIDCE
jgi:hypothetical protein